MSGTSLLFEATWYLFYLLTETLLIILLELPPSYQSIVQIFCEKKWPTVVI